MKQLFVFNMQNGLAKGGNAPKEVSSIISVIKEKIDRYIKEGNLVVFIHDEQYGDSEVISELEVQLCEHIKKKAIGYIDWEHIYVDERASFYRDLTDAEIVGLYTDTDIITNALILKSIYPGANINVNVNCCVATSPEAHKAALEIMKSCQINVIGE